MAVKDPNVPPTRMCKYCGLQVTAWANNVEWGILVPTKDFDAFTAVYQASLADKSRVWKCSDDEDCRDKMLEMLYERKIDKMDVYLEQ